jgi:hypothetical protein
MIRPLTDSEAEALGEDIRDGNNEPDGDGDYGARDYEQQWIRQGEGR